MLLAAILAIGSANAQPGNIGAGLAVGDTSGVSLGWRPNEWNAVQVGLGYDALDGAVKGSADYLQSVAVFDPSRNLRVPVYIGVGADVGRDMGGGRAPAAIGEEGGETDIAARVPIGASLLFMRTPVEVFGQVIPSLRIVPDRQIDVDGTVGFRYHF
jgi:hypothetical protein